MKDKKKMIISILGILMLVVVTVGVTYAVFTYTKLGTTENIVTTGTLKFLYTENTGVGNGINIENAFPVSDAVGKSYDTDKYVFDFSVEATNSGIEEIPYEVTLRKKSTSTVPAKNVKVYLTDMTDDADTEILVPTLYSDLIQTTIDVGEEVEKTIYNGTVLGGELAYLKDFRLRMWIDEKSNQDDINGKIFTSLVNVYSNVPLVSEEELNSRNDTSLGFVEINGVQATSVINQTYQYVVSLPEGTTTTTINPETLNDEAQVVSIEKNDSLTYDDNSNIKRLSDTNSYNVLPGDNYFKITVVSENRKTTNTYILNVRVAQKLNERILSDNTLITKTPNLKTTSKEAGDSNGLYRSNATNNSKYTYYFRGNVTNNYVKFAGFTWRIVRINEDGTVRLSMIVGINNNYGYKYNTNSNTAQYMYYSGSNAKIQLDNWYTTYIANKGYADDVATGNYYCEQAKVKHVSSYSSGNAAMSLYNNYTANFKCNTDANGKGIVNSNIGLITYDEVVHAGGYGFISNTNYYLNNGYFYWTMSPAGVTSYLSDPWYVTDSGYLNSNSKTSSTRNLQPVINLKTTATITGKGTNTDPYVVQ